MPHDFPPLADWIPLHWTLGATAVSGLFAVAGDIGDAPQVATAGVYAILVSGAVSVAKIFADSWKSRTHIDDCERRLNAVERRLDWALGTIDQFVAAANHTNSAPGASGSHAVTPAEAATDAPTDEK